MYNLNVELENALEQERRAFAARQRLARERRQADGRLWSQRVGAALIAVGEHLARADRARSPSAPAAPSASAVRGTPCTPTV